MRRLPQKGSCRSARRPRARARAPRRYAVPRHSARIVPDHSPSSSGLVRCAGFCGCGEDDGHHGNTTRTDLREAAEERYLNYALSVITSRALPDVRDGLKPVQRRILYAMFQNLRLRRRGRASRRPSSATCSASTTRTATSRSTTRWCAWRRTSRCASRWSTARATSARSTATRRRLPLHRGQLTARRARSCSRARLRHRRLPRQYDATPDEPIVLPAPSRSS